MALSELTERAAILAAMREYDELGQDAFLEKYGYSPARRYRLVQDGKSYDSKAIVGVAFKYQFPDRGPLQHSEFSGGDGRMPTGDLLRYTCATAIVGDLLKIRARDVGLGDMLSSRCLTARNCVLQHPRLDPIAACRSRARDPRALTRDRLKTGSGAVPQHRKQRRKRVPPGARSCERFLLIPLSFQIVNFMTRSGSRECGRSPRREEAISAQRLMR